MHARVLFSTQWHDALFLLLLSNLFYFLSSLFIYISIVKTRRDRQTTGAHGTEDTVCGSREELKYGIFVEKNVFFFSTFFRLIATGRVRLHICVHTMTCFEWIFQTMFVFTELKLLESSTSKHRPFVQTRLTHTHTHTYMLMLD